MNSALMLHRHAKPAVAGSYLSGAIMGAVVSASVLLVMSGLVAPLPAPARKVVAISTLLLLVGQAVGVFCLDLPQRKYQIPRETFTASPTPAAFKFAFELGTGVRTYITSLSPYALALMLVLLLPAELVPATLAALCAAVGYGIGRSVVVVIQSLRHRVAVEHPREWLRAADLVALVTAFAVAVTS